MLSFIPIGEPGGDCTCPYSVKSDTPLTVAELVQQILTRKEWGEEEWGEIRFYYGEIKWGTAVSIVEYKKTQLNCVDENFKNISGNLVAEIKARGGCTLMDYDVLIEEN